MSYVSLVHKETNRVLQISKEKFEVHGDLSWVQGPDFLEYGSDAPDYYYHQQSHSIRKKEKTKEDSYEVSRRFEYESLSNQLDMLWHDIDNDLIPGKDSTWYNHIKSVKDKYPKP